MSAVTAQPMVATEPRAAARASVARWVVLVVLVVVALLAAVLVATSLVPSATLAARLLGAAGEAPRTGSNTQELATYLDDRLRFSAAVLLVLVAGLVVTRTAVEDMLAGVVHARALVQARVWAPSWASARLWALVGVPILAAAIVRVPFLGQPMRYDEALTFNEFASRPLYYGLSFYPDPNNHLLNTLLMHLAFLGLGNQPWVLRLPAFVAGVVLVPATYALARLVFGSGSGAPVLASALVAVSSYLAEYSTNGRGYTLQAVSFVVLLSLVIVAARRDSPAVLLLAAVVAALGAYAVPTMLYGVAIAAIWLVIELRSRPAASGGMAKTRIRPAHLLASGLLLGLGVALLYLPVAIVSGADKLVTNRFVVPLDPAQLASELPRSLVQTWAFWNRDIPWPAAALLVLGFLIATLDDFRRKRLPLGLLAPAACLVLVLAQRVTPFERVWLFLLPVYFAIASGGLTVASGRVARLVDARLPSQAFGIVLGAAFGVVLGFVTLTSGSIQSSNDTGAFRDAEAVARTLAPRLAPDDAVVTQVPASLPQLQYYFPRSGLPIDVLVRPPDQAQNLWVVAPAGAAPPAVAGWVNADPTAQFSESKLFELRRVPAAR